MLSNITEHWKLNRLYDEASWSLTKLHSTKENIQDFIDIKNDIVNLLEKSDIKYRHLSIQGLNAHHSINVAILNGRIGQMIGIDSVDDLVLGGLLHDIGKLYISRELLMKTSPLTIKERNEIAKHTDIGYEIVKKLIDNKNVLNMIKNHHTVIQTLPRKTNVIDYKDDDNILFPLICGISDIIDAMLSFRSYKTPLSLVEVRWDLKNKGIEDVDKIFDEIL